MIWWGTAAQNRANRPDGTLTFCPPTRYVSDPFSNRFSSISLCRSGRGIRAGAHCSQVKPYGEKSPRDWSKKWAMAAVPSDVTLGSTHILSESGEILWKDRIQSP